MIGQTYSHYRILEKLGEGGMGEVFLAFDTRLNRKVALKFLRPGSGEDSANQKILLREARSAAGLDHPFICKIIEVAEYEGKGFIVMEYLEGKTLQQRLIQGPLSVAEWIQMATEIAEALEAAHVKGIVHRDLKPANIMISQGGHFKIMDFGVAKQVQAPMGEGTGATTTLASAVSIAGTPYYMSPEQFRGDTLDTRSDIFSLGIILYESLTGTHPFRKARPAEDADSVPSTASSSKRSPGTAIPPILSHIIHKAMAQIREDRYQSVRDLITDLRELRTEELPDGARRLAAIMFTDIVGYSAKSQQNEALAIILLEEHWRLLRPLFPKHHGQEIKTIGDGFLIEFPSALQAAECAIEIQRLLHDRNRTVEPELRMELRIGLHLGDVIHRDKDVFGDGVNISSRIHPLADPGGICLSEDVAHQVRNKIAYPLTEIPGQSQLKNIERAIRLFRVVLPWVEQGADRNLGAPGSSVAASRAPEEQARPLLWRFLPLRRSRQWLLGFGSAIALVVAVMLILPWLLEPRHVLSFAPRDWILITAFDNQTGEPIFDKSLGTSFGVSMQQSKYANICPPSRITDSLKRMGKPANQEVDEQIGREICLREKIRGLVVPGISKIGQQYSLTARIIDPQTGEIVRSYMAPASGENQILAGLMQLAEQIRRDLGESLASIRVDNRDLALVTTPSLEALRQYTEGMALWAHGKYGPAVQSYEAALKIDPDFAKAHSALGACYSSFIFNDRTRAKEHFEKALRLGDRVTPRERQLIQIFYEGFVGNTANETNLCASYLKSYPDDFIERFNYGNMLRDSGKIEEAVAQYKEVLRLNPGHAGAYINLATCYSQRQKYLDSIDSYAKAFELEPTWLTQGNINHEYGYTLVNAGRLNDARGVFQKALSGDTKALALRSLALLDMYNGKYESAKQQLDEALLLNAAGKAFLSEARNHLFLAILLDGRGENKAEVLELDKALKNLEKISPQVIMAARIGSFCARAGETEKAEDVLKKIRGQAQGNVSDQNTEVRRLQGEVDLAKGNYRQAIENLRLADRELQSPFTLESLARAYRVAGDSDSALSQYNELISKNCLGYEAQQDWLAAHVHLAKLYHARGQDAKAQQILGKLLEIWKEADRSLPLFREALQLQSRMGR